METAEVTKDIDPKRQAMLERMAKARAAKGKKEVMPHSAGPGEHNAMPHPSEDGVKPKRKYRKRRRKTSLLKLQTEAKHAKETKAEAKSAKSEPLAPGWLAGLGHSPNGCPIACNAERCVITGDNICQHPDMGNLQAYYLTEPFAEVRARFAAARLELQRLDTEKAKRG